MTTLVSKAMEIGERNYDSLFADREQLRILKNYCKLEEIILKDDILRLIKAMEDKNNE